MDEPLILRRAETLNNEFVGTCAFDGHEKTIAEALELPDKYLVVGFGMLGSALRDDPLGLHVGAYVLEGSAGDFSALAKTVPTGGTVSVIELPTSVTTRQLLEYFSVANIRAVRKEVRENRWRLQVTK